MQFIQKHSDQWPVFASLDNVRKNVFFDVFIGSSKGTLIWNKRFQITQCTNTSSKWINTILKYLNMFIFGGVFTHNSRIINIPSDQKSAAFQDSYRIIIKATKINKFDQRLYL